MRQTILDRSKSQRRPQTLPGHRDYVCRRHCRFIWLVTCSLARSHKSQKIVTFSILVRALRVSDGIDRQPLPMLCWSRKICAYNNTHSAEVEEVAGVVPFAWQISHRLAPIGGHNRTAIAQVIGAAVALAGFDRSRTDVANGAGQGRRRQEPALGVQGEGVDAGAIEFDLGGTVGLDESVGCRGPDGQEEQRDGDARHHVGLS